MPKVELGDMAKDEITGLTGVVVCVSEWLNGCVRITIQSKTLKDGAPIEAITFDEHQVSLVKKGALARPAEVTAKKPFRTGGPRPEPTRNATPR